MGNSLRKLMCMAIVAGCGDDDVGQVDAGDPCLTACRDGGVACQLGDASYEQVLASFHALCTSSTEVFAASCQNSVRALVVGSGFGNTTVFFDSDGGLLGVRTDDEAVDPACDGHAYSPVRTVCNGTISSDVCSDAPVGSAFP